MADWYVSSVAWTALTQFAATTAYTIGNIVRPLTAPAAGHEYAFRCTTAGTSGSEPSWPTADGSTVTTGGATFTNVSGESTYNWNAPAGSLYSISALGPSDRTTVGDRIFLSSDHTESGKGNNYAFNNGNPAFGVIQIISVNRAGSVPPAAGDITSGASITVSSGAMLLEAYCNMFWQGVSLTQTTAASPTFNSSGIKAQYYKNCAFYLNNNGAGQRFYANNPARVIFDNTTLQFGATGQGVSGSTETLDLLWINTASAIQGATVPTTLFLATSAAAGATITCRGVDLSAITGTLVAEGAYQTGCRLLLDSCKIASGVTRYATPLTSTSPVDEVELVNCYDGTTKCLNERYTPAGSLTTERTITLSNGAADDIGGLSLKMVSSSRSDFLTLPLDSFWLDVENTTTGASKTATVEIISSASLNNVDIILRLEYMGTANSTVTSFADSLATALTASSAITSSSATWNSSPATPQKQKLQVTFTPQTAGRVRGLVRLGKTSTTVYVNPQITIT